MAEDKVVLVTGASRGIGKATALQLLEGRTRVVLVARDEKKLTSLAEPYGDRALIFPYDLMQADRIEDIFRYVIAQGFKLNGIFHAAGVSHPNPIRFTGVSEMRETFDINYFSTVQIIRFFMMKKYSEEGASAVVMSSPSARLCEAGMGQYAASKAAVEAFVKVAAKEGIKRHIRVNAISPGYVDTDMVRDAETGYDAISKYVEEHQPFGFIPEEQIAYLAEFLLSEQAECITGAVMDISGGLECV